MDFQRNNLADSSSPYLRQHADNPVWWQEWTPEVLAYAADQSKPLLVSVGYSTCHWCHVMAGEAFSDAECANALNSDFVSIKVDREQRPDIDQYLMAFLVATTGSGGWPLNAFLTPDGRPFYAMTYASTEATFRTPPFVDILRQVREFYDNRQNDILPFEIPEQLVGEARGSEDAPVALLKLPVPDDAELERVGAKLGAAFDSEHGGFGTGQKFPPHSALLFMLYGAAGEAPAGGEPAGQEPSSRKPDGSEGANVQAPAKLALMAGRTLDVMAARGLHDHLQGGFYRYCVDRKWTIPHFEKMLYDQAMLLWVYSLAGDRWAAVAGGVIRSLEETFKVGDFYAAAFDADTDHREGATYLWSMDELTGLLEPDEREAFLAAYQVTDRGNFEGRNHLHRTERPTGGTTPDEADALKSAEERLLEVRRARPQPFRDEKLLTEWNCLAACGLIAAHRYLGAERALERAKDIARGIGERVGSAGRLPHDLADPRGGGVEYLSDYAASLLMLGMLEEEGVRFGDLSDELMARLSEFRTDGTWIESRSADFRPVPAQYYDQPVPSGAALAEAVVLRRSLATHEPYVPLEFRDPLAHGFGNVTALLSRGYFHVIESPEPVDWSHLPVNSMQIRGEQTQTCYRGACFRGIPGQRGPEKA